MTEHLFKVDFLVEHYIQRTLIQRGHLREEFIALPTRYRWMHVRHEFELLLKPIKSSHSFLEQETLPSLLSTG